MKNKVFRNVLLYIFITLFLQVILVWGTNAAMVTVGGTGNEEADPRCMSEMKEKEKKAGEFVKKLPKTKEEADPECMKDMKNREKKASEYLSSGNKSVEESTRAFKEKEKAEFKKVDVATDKFKEMEKKGKEAWLKGDEEQKEIEKASKAGWTMVGSSNKKR